MFAAFLKGAGGRPEHVPENRMEVFETLKDLIRQSPEKRKVMEGIIARYRSVLKYFLCIIFRSEIYHKKADLPKMTGQTIMPKKGYA